MGKQSKEEKAARMRRYYQANKEQYRATARRLTRERRILLRALKSVPCTDCRKKYPPVVMQFDHVRGTKLFTISVKGSWVAKDKLEAELAKCEVVCANCHAIRTEKRGKRNARQRPKSVSEKAG